MIDLQTQVEVLQAELGRVHGENLALKMELASSDVREAGVIEFLDRINPEWLEDQLCQQIGFGAKTGQICLDVLREVASAQLGAGS